MNKEEDSLDDSPRGSCGAKKKAAIPEGLLPSYLASAFGEIYEEDGLAVFGKGLGWLSLLAAFVRFYADVEDGHVSIVEEEQDDSNNLKGWWMFHITELEFYCLLLVECVSLTLFAVLLPQKSSETSTGSGSWFTRFGT